MTAHLARFTHGGSLWSDDRRCANALPSTKSF
jgi:hypothetical protein